MRNYIITFFVAFSVSACAQLRQDQFLIGGNALFSYSKSKELKFTSVQLSPSAGYFFKDKFAGGLRLSFNSDTNNSGSDKFRNSTLSAAPFLRYYILPIEKNINFVTDVAFGYSFSKYKSFTFPSSHKYNYYNVSIIAGPTVFLNERTALEITLGYTYLSRGPIDSTITNKLQLGIGLQIHIGEIKK